MLKKILLIIIVVITILQTGVAQQENNWLSGGVRLDFNTIPPALYPTTNFHFFEASATVSDANGQLLFTTEGSIVYDRNNNMMPNGDNLTGLNLNGSSATSSTTQGALIVPNPSNYQQYYVFSLTCVEMGQNAGRLYYSIVDMTLNNGLGDVVANQKGVYIASDLDEKLTGVTGNHCNVWIMCKSHLSGVGFVAFDFKDSGLNFTPVTSDPAGMNRLLYRTGVLQPSPNRKLILSCNDFGGGGGAEIFDFDPTTGQFSNRLLLDDKIGYYAGCFSPDNTKVYVTTTTLGAVMVKLYQFDLSSPDPVASKTLIGSIGGLSKLKLGPDGKIYFMSDRDHVGLIDDPNIAGSGCNFNAQARPLPTGQQMDYTLPNVVPVFVKDTTVYTYRHNIIANCWATTYTLRPPVEGWDFHWNNNDATSKLVVDTPGIYWVEYRTPPCGYRVDTFQVLFLPPLPATGAVNGCNTNLGNVNKAWVQPSATDTTTYTYTWKQGGNTIQLHKRRGADTLIEVAPGVYTLQLEGANGCDTTLQITIDSPSYHTSFVSDSAICQSDSIRLTNTSSAGDFVTWQWRFGDGDTSTNSDPVHYYQHPGYYQITLIGTTADLCMDSFKQSIIVDTVPQIKFATGNDTICKGAAIMLTPYYTSGIDDLQWQYGDGTTSHLLTPHYYNIDVLGEYIIKITGKYPHCPDTTFADTLHVYAYPIVDIGTDTAICPGQSPITLKNLYTEPSTDYKSLWSTGEAAASIHISNPGLYWLNVNNNGCATADSILVDPDCYMAIPNAFTPNGDGVNDYFFPRQLLSKGVNSFHMQVFNHWGQIVFETVNVTGRGWDGNFNGSQQSEGVYVYLIEVGFINGNRERYKGNVTLLR